MISEDHITPGGLAIRRRPRQGLVIIIDGKVCEINLIEIFNGEAKLQIKAPKDVRIVRRELLKANG